MAWPIINNYRCIFFSSVVIIFLNFVCVWQMRLCPTETQQTAVAAPSAVDCSTLQVIVTHPSPCATPALSPQTPTASATAPMVGI